MQDAPKRQLSLFDSTCLIVGIIIGVGIFVMAPDIAKGAYCWWGVLAIWVVGGPISLCGALGYAELATAYPREGGDYVYLTRAYGRWAGFLFGWVQTAVVRPGDIAVMAFAFAMYGAKIHDPWPGITIAYGDLLSGAVGKPDPVPLSQLIYAAAAVLLLTGINIVGVRQGKWTQNVLTVLKALGLLAIVGVAVASPQAAPSTQSVEPFPLSLALIFVLFAFGGWNEMVYVAAEVKNPRKNIIRALVVGTIAVTVLYLLVNGAFLHVLGYQGLATSEAVATDTVSVVFPEIGGRLISVLVCVSALGAVNGLIFTGARISYAVGADHRAFRLLGTWSGRTGTPVRALLAQGALAVLLIFALGSFVDTIIYTAAAVYSFYMATSLAVIILRFREPDVERPYRVFGYPFTTLGFMAVCGFLIYSAVTYKPSIALIAAAICLLGLPIYWLTTPRGARPLEV